MFRHLLSRWNSTSTVRICCVGGSLVLGCKAMYLMDDAKRSFDDNNYTFPRISFESLIGYEISSTILEPQWTSMEAKTIDSIPDGNKPTSPLSQEESIDEGVQCGEGPTITMVYDFVVVGHGNVGQSAVRTLRQICPTADIAVIDPLRVTSNSSDKVGRRKQNKLDHYRDTVASLNPSTKSIHLVSDQRRTIQYRHGILLATGARGAPPPLELFEDSSLSRVLELRPTELSKNTKRPMMAPENVRRTVIEAASKGAKVAILGSGWEALDLLLVAEQQGRKKPSICFANQGPVWNILPNYLSTELRRKLQKRDIDIQDRSYVRYVADVKRGNKRMIELHTAKTYDLLDTRRTVMDLLVIAPDSFGAKGTATLPTNEIPLAMRGSSDGRPWYKTWSQLAKTSNLEPSTVVCYEDDGRIAVNTELCVASRIYAAGSVAKYPNSVTGNASIAGEGPIDGAEAGRVAAVNMSRDYIGRNSPRSDPVDAKSFASNSLPLWRSDMTSYPGSGDRISTLSSIGIQALCVGNCDSERQATRGFWWTNSSAQRKVTRIIEQADADGIVTSQPSPQRIHQRRMSRQRKKLGLVNPIYGTGVVFYLDNYGRIQGIMTWGLPIAEYEGDTINPKLLEYLKYLIASNAGLSALDAEENHQLVNRALGKASQRLVALAIRSHLAHGTAASHGLDGPIDGFSTPLYRYTEVGTLKNTTVNVLKRKDGNSLGVLGEDLYARDEHSLEEEGPWDDPAIDTTPSNLPTTMYPITVVPFQVEEAYGAKAASLESLVELNRYLAVQRGWEANENRARPGKEDPIWLRPGDERRNTSRTQMVIDAYRQIMFPHRS